MDFAFALVSFGSQRAASCAAAVQEKVADPEGAGGVAVCAGPLSCEIVECVQGRTLIQFEEISRSGRLTGHMQRCGDHG